MKVRIRGLVFAGFAAAVFAQSAMAVNDSDKTVTSKTYVDTNFQNLTQKDPTTGTAPNDVTSIDDESTNDEYPTSRNVYKFVTSTVNSLNSSLNITGDPTKHTDRVTVYEQGHENDPDYITGYKIIVPDAAVAESGSDIGGTAQDPGPEDGTDLTTAQAVYDFVTGGAGTGFQRKLTSGEKASLGVYNADGTSVWKEAGGGNYVTMTEGTNSITFDVPQTNTARKGADDPTTQGDDNEIVAGSYKLATANAVYEYVRDYAGDTYQPKANSSNPQVGIRTGDGTNTPYNSTWYTMMEGQQHGVNSVPFVRIHSDAANSEVHVDLHHERIIGSNSINQGDGYDASGITDQSGNKLATGIAVYNYAAQKDWGIDNAGKHLVVGSDGLVALSTNTNPDIPVPTDSRCAQAGGTHVCALVAYWDSTIGENGGVRYEWTVMAPTGA